MIILSSRACDKKEDTTVKRIRKFEGSRTAVAEQVNLLNKAIFAYTRSS